MEDSSNLSAKGDQQRSTGRSDGQSKNLAGGLRTAGQKKQSEPWKPLVSIVTIVLNDEVNIKKTIVSVLQQSYSPIEYIIIDGGSQDNTVGVIRQYEGNVDYWCSEPDKGISDAFNKGILAATGDYIGILNAGDWYEKDAIEKMVAAFESDPALGVVCGALQFWHGAEREFICQSVPHLLERDMTVTHPSCFVRSEVYHTYGLFEQEYKLAMDYELLLRFKKQGVKFTALNIVLTNMQHSGISEINWKKALEETHRARKVLLKSSFFASTSYYYFILAKRLLRIFMENFGLNSVLGFYRSRLALVKKRRP